MIQAHLKRGIAAVILCLSSATAAAGAYVFAGEANGVDVVTHPNTYPGSDGVVTVRVCIAPGSPNAASMGYSVQNNITAYNQLTPTTGNVKLNSNNNIPSGSVVDFESVALHELGHCLGMAHINAASESGLTGNNQNYTNATDGVDNVFDLNDGADNVIGSSDDLRGDDVNLVWFRRSNNNPFTIDTVIDSTTYSVNTADLPAGHNFAANADRALSTLLGLPKTEAVMQQGTFYDEAQRTLGHDDVATLRYAMSGLDEKESGGNSAKDNYSLVLEYVGISSTNCDINMSFTATTGLAFCAVGGVGIAPGHARITTAYIEFGQGFNWFFNSSNIAPVLNPIGNQGLTEGDSLVVSISATDTPSDILSFSTSSLPAFASFVDNNDGTATLTLTPVLGDASLNTMTVTVTDDGAPALSDSETFDIDVATLDSDGDGIGDYDEINFYGTSPDDVDTDNDGLVDGAGGIVALANLPGGIDANGDGYVDGEQDLGTDPLTSNIGDLAPRGAPNDLLDAGDLLVLTQMVTGVMTPTVLESALADINGDANINAADLLLLQQQLMAP